MVLRLAQLMSLAADEDKVNYLFVWWATVVYFPSTK